MEISFYLRKIVFDLVLTVMLLGVAMDAKTSVTSSFKPNWFFVDFDGLHERLQVRNNLIHVNRLLFYYMNALLKVVFDFAFIE